MVEETLPDHWARGCSSAKMWVNCPGSLDPLPYGMSRDGGGFMADLGTLGHSIAEATLKGEVYQLTPDDLAIVDRLDKDERRWFLSAIKTCVAYVLELQAKYEDCSIEYEQKVKSQIVPEHGGTVDVCIVTPDVLHVVDFKFGSVAVDASDNEQIMSYLNLAREKYGDRPTYFGTIVQPAYRGDQTGEYTLHKLNAFRAKMLRACESSERRSDPTWCQYCPHKSTCSTFAKTSIKAVEEFGTVADIANETYNPTEEDVERLERIALMFRVVRDAFDESSKLLKQWHTDGATLNYHRVSGSNIRSWAARAEADIIDMLTPEESEVAFNVNVKTPKQLQVALGLSQKQFDERFRPILEFTSRPSIKVGVKPLIDELANDLPIIGDE